MSEVVCGSCCMRLESGDGAWEIMATVSVAWVWEAKGKGKGGCCRGVNEGGYNLLLNPHKHNQHYIPLLNYPLHRLLGVSLPLSLWQCRRRPTNQPKVAGLWMYVHV